MVDATLERYKMNVSEVSQQSLTRAVSGQSVMNYGSIFEGFAARGIALDVFHISQTELDSQAVVNG